MTVYSGFRVSDLKDQLVGRGISTKGLTKKQHLIDALEADDVANAKPDSSKRTAPSADIDDDAADEKPKLKQAKTAPSQPTGDAQFADPSKSLTIPVDEGCSLPSTYRVFVDPDDGIIYDAALNQTNASNNNNKFYRVQLLRNPAGDCQVWTRWGRVGEQGQSMVLGNGSLDDAKVHFCKKFKDKSGLSWENRASAPKAGKYVFVERSYDVDSGGDDNDNETNAKVDDSRPEQQRSEKSTPQSMLAAPVRLLLELIFNLKYLDATMQSLNYDSNKLPLGKLSKATIIKGFQALKDLSALLDDPSTAYQRYQMSPVAAQEHFSNLFYSLIPHSFGRNRPPVIRTQQMLKTELELLESLSDLKDADNILKEGKDADVHPLDASYRALNMREMTPLDPNSVEYNEVSQYLLRTRGETHTYVSYTVVDIFRIQRAGEAERFAGSPYVNVVPSDRRLLWHGSRAANYGGILGQGLRIAPPEAPVNGYMFDKGIYLADMSSKSANYCHSYISDGEALLLLCEAELGQMQILQDAKYDAATTARNAGLHSTWGQGEIGPVSWKDAGILHDSLKGVKIPDTTQPPHRTKVKHATLMYNEYICYDVAQVQLRYLLRVRM